MAKQQKLQDRKPRTRLRRDQLRRSVEPEIAKEKPDTPQNVRVKTEVLDTLVNITGELITHKNRMITISKEHEVARTC